MVDMLLAKHTRLNELRSEGYIIRQRLDGTYLTSVPYDRLLRDLQIADRNFPALTLFDAKAVGLFSIPERCELQAQIGGNVYVPAKYPTSLVLRHNKLWFEVPDENVRRYLLGYLSRPQWRGKSWDEFKNEALIPEDDGALAAFFAAEAQKMSTIVTLLADIKRIDAEIDERVLDLYGITDAEDRERILGSAPVEEDEIAEDEEAL